MDEHHKPKRRIFDETRKEERRKLMAFTPVLDLGKKSLLGYVGDLTLQGVLVVGEKPVEVDQLITLVIDFPETPEIYAKRVIIPARAAWCEKKQDDKYFDTGFEFQKVEKKDKIIIESILERYQYRRGYPG
jgi:hypothetical protein